MSAFLKKQLYILGLYLIIVLVMMWPLILAVTDTVVGQGGDPWQTIWRFEEKENMFKEAISDRNVTGWLFYEFFGGGEPRLINISVWPWMDLHLLFGQPLAYNLIWLLSFILSGYAMYWLVRYLLFETYKQVSPSHDMAAVVAGLFYMFLPYRIAHANGHFGAMQMQWLPLVILWLLLWMKRPGLGNTLLLALWMSVQAWSEHHYMLWLVVFGLCLAVWRVKEVCLLLKPNRLPYAVLLGALLLLFVVMPYWPTVRLSDKDPGRLDLGAEQTIRYSANPLSYVTPATEHPVWGDFWYERISGKFTGNKAEATQFAGWLPLALIIVFWRKIPGRQKYFWVGITGLFFVISLGPRLHLLGRVTDIPLLYAWLDNWPVFSAVRTVGRAAAVVYLGMAVLLGYILAGNIKKYVPAVLVGLVILLEFLFVPVTLQSTHISSVYEELDQVSGTRIVEIPGATDYTFSSKSLYASHRHDKEVLGLIALERGMDTSESELLQSLPALRQLLYLKTADFELNRTDFFEQNLEQAFLNAVRYLDIGAIVLHTEYMSGKEAAVLTAWLEDRLDLKPLKRDKAILYITDNLPAGDGIILVRDGSWRNVSYDAERDTTLAVIKDEAEIKLINVTDQVLLVELSLKVLPNTPGNLNILREETELKVSREGGRHTVIIDIPPGESVYTFINEGAGDVVVRDMTMTVR